MMLPFILFQIFFVIVIIAAVILYFYKRKKKLKIMDKEDKMGW